MNIWKNFVIKASFRFQIFLKIRLYFLCSYLEYIKIGQLAISKQIQLQSMFQKVCDRVEKIHTEDLFLVRDVLFAGLGSCELLNDLELFKLAVEKLNWISEKTRDFQKQPIVLMLEWKYYIQTDYDTAKKKYEEAKMMARMFGNEKLIVSLDNEWAEDLEDIVEGFIGVIFLLYSLFKCQSFYNDVRVSASSE